MPRSSAQSDFTVQTEPERPPESRGAASGIATRIVMTVTFLVLGALLLLTLIGPHVPAGE